MAESHSSTSFLGSLRCPRDHNPLERTGLYLKCKQEHEYPIVDGIPVLLLHDRQQTIQIAEASLAAASESRGVSHRKTRYLPQLWGSVKPKKKEFWRRLVSHRPGSTGRQVHDRCHEWDSLQASDRTRHSVSDPGIAIASGPR